MTSRIWSIRNPIPSHPALLLLPSRAAGFKHAGGPELPRYVDLPTVNVTATLPGAAPAQLETEVARKIEDALAARHGLRARHHPIPTARCDQRSPSSWRRPCPTRVERVRDAVTRIRADLPADMMQTRVTKLSLCRDSGSGPMPSRSSRLNEAELSWFVDNDVTKAAPVAVPGVGRVTRVGGVEREVRVELDPTRLAALASPPATTRAAPRSPAAIRQAAGRHRGRRADDPHGRHRRARVAIWRRSNPLPNGRSVRLDDVATRHGQRRRAPRWRPSRRQAGGRVRDQSRRGARTRSRGVADDLDKLEGGAAASQSRDRGGVRLIEPIQDNYEVDAHALRRRRSWRSSSSGCSCATGGRRWSGHGAAAVGHTDLPRRWTCSASR